MNTSVQPLPLALRDTVLLVTELADGAKLADTFDTFRTKCLELMKRMRDEFQSAGHPGSVVEDAAYAQCALLDEFALRRLQGEDRNAWEREPLQVKEFDSHNAGEELIARIEHRLTESQPVVPLLTVFQVVLGLGFQGKFALDGGGAREILIRAIDARLAHAGVHPASGPIIVTGSENRRMRQLSPVAWVLIACVGAGLVYLALDRWLAASIARIAG
jgi:type VI secretion system protein ImpK